MRYKAVVLISGGIDSTTCLALAIKEFGAKNVLGVSINYGQKHVKENQAAIDVCKFYGVELLEQDLSRAFSLSDCPLLQTSTKELDHSSYGDQLEAIGGSGTVASYVPFRNGLFLSFATAIALSVGAERVYYGAHADDAAGRAYPDCTPEFIKAMGDAIWQGTGGQCSLWAPLMWMVKAEVVKRGLELKAPYHLTWSCYEGKDAPCGVCGTCIDRALAFECNSVKDPALKGEL